MNEDNDTLVKKPIIITGNKGMHLIAMIVTREMTAVFVGAFHPIPVPAHPHLIFCM
jgi:DNA-binding cell septation regulator SpoVG